ncbi:hypothetical protein QE152_g26277 [Popillia japonica]|uniref:Uncharacterized protein n=1 Tax=Popillia japonica TaxID=7064 RepID=A0AAW1JZS2_POPJA
MNKYEDVTGRYDASDISGDNKGSNLSETLPHVQSDPVSIGSVVKTTPDSRLTRKSSLADCLTVSVKNRYGILSDIEMDDVEIDPAVDIEPAAVLNVEDDVSTEKQG